MGLLCCARVVGLKQAIVRSSRRALPKRWRDAIFHYAFHLSPAEFQRFAHRYAYAPSQSLGLQALRRRGVEPRSIADVGAFRGEWSRMVRGIWPHAQLAMIEGNAALEDRLVEVAGELHAELHCALVGAEDGEQVRFFTMGSGSSVFPERSGLPRTEEVCKLRCLDGVLGGWKAVDLIKIDAEGYELEVLRGGQRLLRTARYVLLEVSIIQTNVGAPLLPEVIDFMRGRGFRVCDILEFHRRSIDRALNKIDIFFARGDSHLFAENRHSL